jgi:hypothetical protein
MKVSSWQRRRWEFLASSSSMYTEAALVVDVESGKEESALSVVPQGRRSSGRSEIRLRDLRCLGRPTRLVVRKRR